MRHSETLSAIAPAIVAALAEIEGASKGAVNPHFKNRYANLEAVIDASKATLAKHGLALMQFPGAMQGNAMTLETVLLHTSGEWLTGSEAFGVALAKADPQGIGSALTYARRYAQMSALNMPAVDDDGEAATNRQGSQSVARKSSAQAKRDGDDEKIKGAIAACKDEDELNAWFRKFDQHTAHLPLSWLDSVRDMGDHRRNDIIEAQRAAA